MKTNFLLIPLTIICLSFNYSFAQDTCMVLKHEIAGTYKGKCKNGLAHGKGIAEGKDKYIGRFKKGLPDGDGKYIWSTGEVYDGNWMEGKKEGAGKYYYKKNGVDSVRIGIWKNDYYSKKIVPNPYSIVKTLSVSRYSVRRVGDGEKVIFSITQNGNPSGSYSNLQFTASSGNSLSLGSKQGFENILFPFTCRVTFSMPNSFRTAYHDVEFEIKITEPGSWEVIINN